jgi:CheY-like chemotaxis protein
MPGPVLVVDDDIAIRECLAEVLAIEGYDVREARNGREGLNALVNAHPRVVVLDLMMPVMDGWQFLEEQKAMPDVARVPVVVTTACGAEPPEAACVLHKPFDMHVLLGIVARLAAPAAASPAEDARPGRELPQ